MAREKEWLDRLPAGREKVSVLPPDFPVDRDLVESVLDVSARTALRILQSLGALPDASGRLTLTAAAFLAAVEAAEIQATLAARQQRQKGKEDLLAIKRRFGRPQDPAFPLTEARAQWRLEDLPSAIRLEPGRLTVEFTTLPDLLWQLEVLVATLGDDSAAVEERVLSGGAPA